MRPSGPRKWSGQLYDPDSGRTFSGNLIEIDQNTIRIEGCALFICGGEELHCVNRSARDKLFFVGELGRSKDGSRHRHSSADGE